MKYCYCASPIYEILEIGGDILVRCQCCLSIVVTKKSVAADISERDFDHTSRSCFKSIDEKLEKAIRLFDNCARHEALTSLERLIKESRECLREAVLSFHGLSKMGKP